MPEVIHNPRALELGATHYQTMADGVTPQMYYKQEDIKFDDGTSVRVWVYLSYCNLWQGSQLTRKPEEAHRLKEIEK
jgi:hypothetical protein